MRRFCNLLLCRGVAQSGSALSWGFRGRRFKSCLPDQIKALFFAGPYSLQIMCYPRSMILYLRVKPIKTNTAKASATKVVKVI